MEPADVPGSVLTVLPTLEYRADVEEALHSVGRAVVSVSSGREALSVALRRKLDLVVLAVSLPDMEGWEVAHHLKNLARTRPIPIVFLGQVPADGEGREQGILLGTIDAVVEPVGPDALERALLDALSRAGERSGRQANGELRDVRGRRLDRAARDAGFLLRFDAALSGAEDARVLFSKVAHALVPELGDFCLVDEIDPHRGIRALATAHAVPEVDRALRGSSSPRWREPRAPFGVGHAWRSGRPELQSVIPDAAWLAGALGLDASESALLERVGAVSCMFLPVSVDGRIRAVITVCSSAVDRAYDAADLALGEHVADRAAFAYRSVLRYRRLMAAKQARDALLGAIAHDLRNPLGAIMASAAMLERAAQRDGRSEREKKALGTILRAAERMERLTGDVQDFARLERRQLRVEARPVDGKALLLEACRREKDRLEEKAIGLSDDTEEAIAAVGDRARIIQILSHALAHAIDRTPEGGAIRIRAQRSGGEAVFSIADTGPEIPRRELAQALDLPEPEQRGLRPASGLGLGLPIAKGLVEAQGGRIWFESEAGHGATLYFTLPLAPIASAIAPSTPDRSPRDGGTT